MQLLQINYGSPSGACARLAACSNWHGKCLCNDALFAETHGKQCSMPEQGPVSSFSSYMGSVAIVIEVVCLFSNHKGKESTML